MPTGGGPEVPGHLRELSGIDSSRYGTDGIGRRHGVGVPEEDDATHYGSGTRDKADYLDC
jgi:hypothetical protein